MSFMEDKCVHGVARDSLSYAGGVRCKECEEGPLKRQCVNCGAVYDDEPASMRAALRPGEKDPGLFCPTCRNRTPGKP